MRKPVTSRTIAAISSWQHRESNPQTPSVQDVLTEIRRKNPPAAVALERHLLSLPRGFEVAPVLYAPVPKEKKEMLEFEYVSYVRPDFMRFLAAKRADDLRALGICENGIERMRAGYHPVTTDGARYAFNVDHIVERAGSQTSLARVKAIDTENPRAGGRKTHLANHFSNMIFLPLGVHAYKNKLAALQNISSIPAGGQRWVLMLVPNDRTRHVAPPQPLGQEASLVLQSALDYPVVVAALAAAEAMADCYRSQGVRRELSATPQEQRAADIKYVSFKGTVADHCGYTLIDGGGVSIEAVFLSMIAHDPAAGRFVQNSLRPALQDMAVRLAEMDANPKLDRAARLGILRHPRFIAFCVEASRYPLAEAMQVLRDYRRIYKKTQSMPTAAVRPGGKRP